MEPKITSFSVGSATRNGSVVRLVPRKPMGTEPFTAQQRDGIIVRFHKLSHSISRIARSEGVGDIAVENVLRHEYWRANGRRKSDRIARAA